MIVLPVAFVFSYACSADLRMQSADRLRLSSGVLKRDKEVLPQVPETLSEFNGTIVTRVVIGRDGSVRDVCVISGPEVLRQSYVEAVKQWRYQPFLKNGKPVEVETQLTLTITYGGPSLPVGRVHVASGVMAGRLVRRVDPVFPPIPPGTNVSGATVLHLVVGRDGKVLQVEAVSGPEAIRDQAVHAVRQWEYQPYLQDGLPVEVDTSVVMNIDFGG